MEDGVGALHKGTINAWERNRVSKFSIIDKHQWAGEWFLPSVPEHQVPGVLKWEGHASLQLNGSLELIRSGSFEALSIARHPVVHGVTTSGHRVTLLHVQKTGSGLHMGSAGVRFPANYRSSWIVVGDHVMEDTLYGSARFEVPGMDLWLNRHWFTANIDKEFVSVVMRKPEADIVEIESIEADVELALQVMTGPFGPNAITGRSVGTVTTRPKTKRSAEWHLDQMGKVLSLMAMVGGTSFAPRKIQLKIGDGAPLDALVALRASKECHLQKHHEFYMLSSDAGLDVDKLVRSWFDLFEQLEMPIQLTLSALASDELWLHLEFLTLMQCLEGFHRASYPGLYMGRDDYEAVAAAVASAIPADLSPDHRRSLKSRIGYGNEISLAKRLGDLARQLDASLISYLLGGNGKVPQRWIDTRNYYTHWDEASRDKVLRNSELHHVNARLRHWLRALYLDRIGVPHDKILKAAQGGHKDSQFLLQIGGASVGRVQVGLDKEG